MGGSCSRPGENLNGRDHLGHIGVDWRIILKWRSVAVLMNKEMGLGGVLTS
jgi:hypothetical protein